MEEKKNSSPFIELVNRFWIVNIECSLETSDIALFFALHHFCNQVVSHKKKAIKENVQISMN